MSVSNFLPFLLIYFEVFAIEAKKINLLRESSSASSESNQIKVGEKVLQQPRYNLLFPSPLDHPLSHLESSSERTGISFRGKRQQSSIQNALTYPGANFLLLEKQREHKRLSLSEPAMRKRDIAGVETPFARRQRPPLNQYDQRISNTKLNFSKDDCIKHIFAFWVDNFALNGSVETCFRFGNRLKIMFTYKKTGEGNASIWLVKPRYLHSVLLNHNNPRLNRFQTPQNCQPQNNINTQRNEECSDDEDKRESSTISRTSSQGDKEKGSFVSNDEAPVISKRKAVYKIGAKPCKLRSETLVKTWMCLNSTFDPCFVFNIDTKSYKLTERICPKVPLQKSRMTGKRHKTSSP